MKISRRFNDDSGDRRRLVRERRERASTRWPEQKANAWYTATTLAGGSITLPNPPSIS